MSSSGELSTVLFPCTSSSSVIVCSRVVSNIRISLTSVNTDRLSDHCHSPMISLAILRYMRSILIRDDLVTPPGSRPGTGSRTWVGDPLDIINLKRFYLEIYLFRFVFS